MKVLIAEASIHRRKNISTLLRSRSCQITEVSTTTALRHHIQGHTVQAVVIGTLASAVTAQRIQDFWEQCQSKNIRAVFIQPSTKELLLRRSRKLSPVTIFYKMPSAKQLWQAISSKIETVPQTQKQKRQRQLHHPPSTPLPDVDGDAVFFLRRMHLFPINNNTRKITGYTNDEISQLCLWDIVHPDYIDSLKTLYHKIRSHAKMRRGYEIQIMKKNREVRWIYFTLGVVQEHSERKQIVVFHDITEQKHQQEIIERLARQNELFLNSLGIAVFSIDHQGVGTFVNDAAVHMLGYAKAELMGHSIHRLIHHTKHDGQVYPETECRGRLSFYDRQHHKITDEYVWKKDGTRLAVEYISTPILEQGKVIGSICAMIDVTEQRTLEILSKENRERYRLFADNVSDVIWTMDEHFQFEYLSPSITSLLGYTLKEIQQNHSLHSFHQVMMEFTLSLVKNEKQTGQLEHEFTHKDGTLHWTDTTITLINDTSHSPYAVVGITRNVTHKKKSQETVKKLLQALEQTDEVIFITDIKGTFTYANPAFTKVYGYDTNEVMGNNARILKSGLYDTQFYDRIREAVLTGRNVHGEITNRTKSGKQITVEGSVNPIFDEQQIPIGYITVHKDITEKKRIEQERQELEKQLYHSQQLESTGRLANGIAHDFNNILGMIQIAAETIMLSNPQDPDIKDSAEMIINVTKRGASLAKELLLFARIDRGNMETVSVGHILQEFGSFLEKIFPKIITVHIQIEAEHDLILGDSGHLHQILMNLAMNAKDAMPAGGTLQFRLVNLPEDASAVLFPQAPAAPNVVLFVSDTGTGIDDQTRPHIFDPFFTTKEQGKGTGLGLSIVHSIVKNHSGFIHTDSIPGSGTTFSIFFPAAQTSASIPAKVIEELPHYGHETVLIVEDEESIRTSLSTVLQKSGYTVLQATNGLEAINLCRTFSAIIDVILTDLDMPVMDGLQLIELLAEENVQCPVLVITGLANRETGEHLATLGVQHIITKPFSLIEILKTIRSVLNTAPSSVLQ